MIERRSPTHAAPFAAAADRTSRTSCCRRWDPPFTLGAVTQPTPARCRHAGCGEGIPAAALRPMMVRPSSCREASRPTLEYPVADVCLADGKPSCRRLLFIVWVYRPWPHRPRLGACEARLREGPVPVGSAGRQRCGRRAGLYRPVGLVL